MSLALVTMSHSPLLDHANPPAEITEAVQNAFTAARAFTADYDPTLVVSFAPDHYNGFFHDLMPPFCIGYQAIGVGDYGTTQGPLNVPAARAEELAHWVAGHDLDVAISRRMEVDHGAVQPLEILFGTIDAVPTIPVFVNSLTRPFVSIRRIRRLGEAIGSYLTALEDERILLIGSGGLSHDPPVPQWATADDPTRAILLNGRHPTPAARNARQQRVIDTAAAFTAGTATIRDLNPAWDQALMATLASGDLTPLDTMTPEQMTKDAGSSSHEIRTWIAAFAALNTAGPYDTTYTFYRPIREYIAGFGIMTAHTTP